MINPTSPTAEISSTDLAALHTGTFRLRKDMSGAFLYARCREVPRKGWAEGMPAFTLLP